MAHLQEVDRNDQARTLLFDFGWLSIKLARIGIQAVLDDFEQFSSALAQENALQMLYRALEMRVIRSVSSVENRFPPVVLPQWHIDNEFRKLLASFEKIIPLKYPSDLQDSTTLTAKLLTRSEGTIGELKTLLAAAATEAMRSGTERLTEEIIDGCNYVPPSTRKQRLVRG